MSEIIIPGVIKDVDRNYNYKVDRDGNLIRERYRLWKDPYTLVTICVILMGILYYTSILNNPLTVKNIDYTCENLAEICGRYLPLKDRWIAEHPGEKINVREVIDTEIEIKIGSNITKLYNLTNG